MTSVVKYILVFFLALVVVVEGGSGVSYAQERLDSNVAHEEDPADWMVLWTRIQKIRLDEMKTALKLDDDVMDRLAPRLVEFDTQKRAIGKERLRLLRELKVLTKAKADEVQETLNRLEANHAALEAVQQETKAHLSEHLTPQQQAQYILFQRDFNARLRGLIQKERGKK